MKANFVEIVKAGTCNYICRCLLQYHDVSIFLHLLTSGPAQRNVNHFLLDGSRRMKIILPETFDVKEFSDLLHFNIRARQASGSLYVLDLAKCHDFLKKLSSNSTTNNGSLRRFIDQTLVKTESWHKCVKEVDPSKDKTVCFPFPTHRVQSIYNFTAATLSME